MSVTLQEGQVKDLLTLPGGKSALRNSCTVIGEEVTAGGVTQITGRPQQNTLLSLTNQIAFALKANAKKTTKKAKHRRSKQIDLNSSDDSASDSDSYSDITESSDESSSGSD